MIGLVELWAWPATSGLAPGVSFRADFGCVSLGSSCLGRLRALNASTSASGTFAFGCHSFSVMPFSLTRNSI